MAAEKEMLVGEIFKACKNWIMWEEVCDLMSACLSGNPNERMQMDIHSEFFFFLKDKFHTNHPMWSNVNFVGAKKKAG